MTSEEIQKMIERMKPQSDEFDAVQKLCQSYNSLPQVVDDDYPEQRYYYENAVEDLVRAFQANGRLRAGTRMGKFFPKVVCLCGSTRFYDAFQKANYDLTCQGHIVLSVGFYVNNTGVHGEGVGCNDSLKIKLDELHKRKIDLADEIFVLNVGGYVGESTKSEIEWAKKTRKLIRYLEPL